MARPTTTAFARIRDLSAAWERAKKLPCGELLTSRPMSDLIGVNWVTLRKWTREVAGFAQCGAFEAGERGREYTFEPRATILFLLRHFEAEREAGARKSRRLAEIIGGDGAAQAAETLTMPELKQSLDVSITIRERQIIDRQLVKVDPLRTTLSQVFSEMQQAGARAIQEADPSGRWSPEEREIAENVARTMLLKQKRSAEDALGRLNGGVAQP